MGGGRGSFSGEGGGGGGRNILGNLMGGQK